MDLINVKVRHKIFGEGTIVAKENSHIIVRFNNDERKFKYPNAFDAFLIPEDSNVAVNIKREVEAIEKLVQLEKERTIEQEKEKHHQITINERHTTVKTKTYPRVNIAFKCNYCDGGCSNEDIGFNGVCSDEIIINNIEIEKRTWCSSDDCDCRQYLNGKITRSELDNKCSEGGFVCYESQMLKDWIALAGIVQTGVRKGQPMKLNRVQNNSLCVLTTRMPNSTESERCIFEVFLVDETYEGDNYDAGYVTTKSKYRISMSPQQAKNMLFWNYHANENKPELAVWSSGLHRYFEDKQAIQILQDVARLKENTDEEKLAKEFLSYFAKINNLDIGATPEKNGALQKK